MIEISPETVAHLLYLVHGDPEELEEALGELRPPDIAEALRELPPEAAAKVMAALPFDLAVQVFDEPELTRHRCAIIRHIDAARVGPLIEAMSADQQADLFREEPAEHRKRLLATVSESTRTALQKLLQYPQNTAGGIMTTEFVSIPSDWTVDQALRLISEVGGRKETVYAIYVIDPETQALVHVVSLRELLTVPRDENVLEIGSRRAPLTVGVDTDREEAARLISKYNLLASAGDRRAASHPRYRHGRRRDRYAGRGADRGRPALRRYGGPERSLHGDQLPRHDQEARRVAVRALSERDAHRYGNAAAFRERSRGLPCSQCSSRS